MEATVITATELGDNLSDCLHRVDYQGERFIVTLYGTPKAVLVNIDCLEEVEEAWKVLRTSLMKRVEGLEDALSAWEAREADRKRETVPWEDVKVRLMKRLEDVNGG